MDLVKLFCEVDDYCLNVIQQGLEVPNNLCLPDTKSRRNRASELSHSEILTILIYFHQSTGFRNFKGYYQHFVQTSLQWAFPRLVSYERFVCLMERSVFLLCGFLQTRLGKCTGISFVDSTKLKVCENHRARKHKVFQDLASWGKTSIGWFYGLKLHLVINHLGEMISVSVSPGNVDDRKPIPRLMEGMFGKLFGDKGYISAKLFEELFEKGVQLFTTIKKHMKPRLMKVLDKLLLRKRSIIETINDLLKNSMHIEHTRHRKPANAMANLISGLIAYTYQDKKPAIFFTPEEEDLLKKVSEENIAALI